jgi:PAS domain S-box-containing protein
MGEEDITPQKQTEQALHESEARFRSLFELSRDGIFAVDVNGRILMANSAAERLAGYSEKELRQFQFLDICAPECRDAAWTAFIRDSSIGQTGEIATVLICRDGRRVDLQIDWSPMIVDGRMEGAYCIARDITEKKIAERKIQDSEERFRQATEAIGGLVYEADLRNLAVRRWAGLFELLGYRAGEVPDRADWWWEQIHPDDVPELKRIRSSAFQMRVPVIRAEYRIRHQNGQWIWVSDSSRVLYDDLGRATRLIGCTISVDDRKNAQESLLESEARHRRLFESDIIGIIYTQDDWVVDANDMFLQMVGYTREDLESGRINWRSMTPPEFLIRDDNAIRELLEKGSAAPFEKEYIRKYGSRVSILIGVALLQREPLKCVCFVLDITERMWMEEELRSARDDLERRVRERTTELENANRILQQIPAKLIAVQEKERKRIAGELHDGIGQTLVAVKLGIEAVLLGRGRGSAKNRCKALEVFIPTLQHLIKEIKLICMGLRPTVLDDLGLIATMQWLCGEFEKLHQNHSLKLEQSVMEDEVPADIKIEIFRITQEALNNIAKHSKAKYAKVSLMHDRDRIELTVSDDGVGMNLDFVLRTRVTRLGLTSMRERTERTGGDFSIESASGKGTTIRASWPVV